MSAKFTRPSCKSMITAFMWNGVNTFLHKGFLIQMHINLHEKWKELSLHDIFSTLYAKKNLDSDYSNEKLRMITNINKDYIWNSC